MAHDGGPQVVIHTLRRQECVTVLARNTVGRLAFTVHGRVDIQPLLYAYEAGWIYGRTSAGAKLDALARDQWVAFEVDEVRGTFDWASVVVHGSFHRLDDDGDLRDVAARAHAVTLLRAAVPETLTAADPVPFRTVFFRIAVGSLSGRLAAPA